MAATLYSLIESAKLCDVDPRNYLKEVVVSSLEGRPVPMPHEYAGTEIS